MPTTKYIPAREFGERLDPPLTEEEVIKYCIEGKIRGAFKMSINTKGWVMPENAIDPRIENNKSQWFIIGFLEKTWLKITYICGYIPDSIIWGRVGIQLI